MDAKSDSIDFDLKLPVPSFLEEEEIPLEPLSKLPSLVTPEPILVCKCLTSAASSVGEVIPERKKLILSKVARTENYLHERRIPELIRFLLTKILQRDPKSNVADYTAQLLDDCMIFRAGLGVAPVLFEERHLEAVIKSFDPSQRGWMSTGQVRRAFITLGLTPPTFLLRDERIPTDVVLDNLRVVQEQELFDLLSAGVPGFQKKEETSSQDSSSTN